MPVRRGRDGKGPYYVWGQSGKRYHYTSNDKRSRERAKEYAAKQGRAIKAQGR